MNDTMTLTLKNDYLFKLLLGSEENKACLQDFLECVLDMPAGMIADLELLDKELSKDRNIPGSFSRLYSFLLFIKFPVFYYSTF